MSHELPQVLKKAGLKNTPARKLILGVFSSDCRPINAEFIYGKLKSKNINQVTIYRTLSSLERADIIKKVDLRKGSAYYELADHHHHIICTDCGIVESFDNCDINDLSKNVLGKSSKFKAINQHSLEFFGVCKSCAKS